MLPWTAPRMSRSTAGSLPLASSVPQAAPNGFSFTRIISPAAMHSA